ncbi:type II toxin-antitoxin system RelE/ParE family toxin [Rubrimonas cliftonensis]|uniref:Toxin ParE1/3/4 n=1 Tax=Rubrimonas cliftonensis TaxID=89524 RepID=A0A1H4G878_9RHOB|nr:type II toxin-antitoxin system RelE/ParE family toxin [Rubrimonas cliftonensis]SEB05799.1 toxin ParE1/3/4 [Rubrimonas cliftonensis]
MAVEYTPRARADLADIWGFTADRWGEAQADRYVRDIDATARAVAAGAAQTRDLSEARPGYRRAASGSHFLIVRGGDDGALIVVRVLHRRMDIDRHLDP